MTPGVADKDKPITCLADLKGKKIASLTGTSFDVSINRVIPDVTHMYFNDYSATVQAVLAGKVSAWAADAPVARLAAAQFPELSILPELICVDHYGLAVRKGHPLGRQASEVIERFKKDGTMKAMEDKWFGADPAVKTIPDLSGKDGFDGRAGVIRFGHDTVTEPMSYVGDKGASLGLDVELAVRIAHALNMKIERVPMNFGGLIAALQSEKVDMVAGCMTITEERKKSVDFTVSYYSGGQALLVKKALAEAARGRNPAVAEKITDVSQLAGKKVGILTGSAYDGMLKKHIPGAVPEYFNAFSDQTAALKAGKISGFLVDEPIARDITNKTDGVTFLKKPLSSDGYAFAFSKNQMALQGQVNTLLKEMRANGEIAKIDAKWFGKDEAAKILPGRKPDGKNGVLRFATNSNLAPFAYIKDGKIVGYDIEIAEAIAGKLGRRLEIVNLDFAAIIPSLVAGKSDMAGCCITVTRERADSVLFSDPDYTGGVVVMVGKGEGTLETTAGGSRFWTGLAASFRRTFVTEDRYKLVWQGIQVTLLISVLSAVFGTLLGFGVCMMRRAKSAWLYIPAKVFIRAIQGTPIVVLLMILYYVIFGGVDIDAVFVAIIGFSINFAAYVSEMMRTGIDAVDKGQHEAAVALGFNRVEVFAKITFPQAARHVLPVFKGEFISMLKATSIVGYIAIQDLTKMSDIIRSRTYEAFFPLIATALIYFAIAYAMMFLLSLVEVKVDPKRRARVVKGVARS